MEVSVSDMSGLVFYISRPDTADIRISGTYIGGFLPIFSGKSSFHPTSSLISPKSDKRNFGATFEIRSRGAITGDPKGIPI